MSELALGRFSDGSVPGGAMAKSSRMHATHDNIITNLIMDLMSMGSPYYVGNLIHLIRPYPPNSKFPTFIGRIKLIAQHDI
jgi:hypothetical protein